MSSDRVCPTFRKLFIASVFGVVVCLIPNGAQSATTNTATVQWAANSESDLAGYRVYQGTTSGSYGPAVDVGNTTVYTPQNLEGGLMYYFAVTAHDTSGNESPPSLEVSTQIPAPPSDPIPPEIMSPALGSTLAGSTENFQWSPGLGWVEYWLGVGTSQASVANSPWGDIFAQSTGANTSQVVSGVPLTGNPVYVRLWYKKEDGSWYYTDATYTAASTDSIPPSITLTAPAPGSTLAGAVTITATATDNIGVVGIQFQLNGTDLGAEETTNPYAVSWDTTEVASGQYTLTAIARDAAGNTTSSDPVLVTVASSSPPATLSVSVVGSGTVTSSPTGILCTQGTCSAAYGVGSTVTLIAKADKKWKFAGWSGACSGTGECVLQVSMDQVVGATFSQNGNGAGRGRGEKK